MELPLFPSTSNSNQSNQIFDFPLDPSLGGPTNNFNSTPFTLTGNSIKNNNNKIYFDDDSAGGDSDSFDDEGDDDVEEQQLFGQGGSRGAAGGGAGGKRKQMNQESSSSSGSSGSSSSDSEEGSSSEEDSEEDAAKEFNSFMTGNDEGLNEKRKNKIIARDDINGKGKGRALDDYDQDEDEEMEEEDGQEVGFEDRKELGRLISAIRNSSTTLPNSSGRTALDKEFDRSIAEELEGIDDEIIVKPSSSKQRSSGYNKNADEEEDEEEEEDENENIRIGSKKGGLNLAKSGYPKRKVLTKRLGPSTNEPEPSPEVRSMLGQANQHYAAGETNEALIILQEVIRIDPNIRSSWYTLATIHEEKGDLKKSIELKIVAAHLGGGKGAKKEWGELADQAREHGLIQQAIYCFTQAIKGNKDDTDSMWDRANLLKMSGNGKQAIKAFTSIANLEPHNAGVLRELIPLLVEEESYTKATELLLSALEFHQLTTPHLSQQELESEELFSLSDLETLADLLIKSKLYSKTISIIKSGIRWLQGREQDTIWSSIPDDREFDTQRKIRESWEKEKESIFIEGAPIYELDPRMRVRLGTARMGEGRIDEAKYHFDVILQEEVSEFPELFGAVADCYFEKRLFSEALVVYQEMASDDNINGPLVWMKVGQCSHELGELEDARDCYEAVTAEEPDNIQAKMQLARLYEQMNEPTKALAMITDVIAAQKHLREEALSAGAASNAKKSRTTSTASKNRQPLTKEGRIARHADRLAAEELRHSEFAAAFQKLQVLDPDIEGNSGNGSKMNLKSMTEWLEIATYLVDSFRETTQLFPSDPKKKFRGVLTRNWTRKGTTEDVERQAGEMASRLERNLDKDDQEVEEYSFRGLHFDKWLTLIIKYAFLLTQNDEVEAGLETLIHVSAASPFKQSDQRSVAISLARIACTLHVGDYAKTLEVARLIWVRYSYRTDALRLFQCLLPSGIACIETFNTAPLQKYAIRQLKGIATSAEKNGTSTGNGNSKSNNSNNNKGKGKAVPRFDEDDEEDGNGPEKDEEEDDEEDEDENGNGKSSTTEVFKPTTLNPLYLTTYGTMLLTSRSFQSAIIYLLRAYDISPEEPLVNLSLGVAYLHRAMSRQTDNRQHQIAQGMAFLTQYRKALGSTQEVEYNFARAYHHLGQYSFAVKHYEKVLSLAKEAKEARMVIERDEEEEEDEEDEEEEIEDPYDYSKVAAYNLSELYVYSGLAGLGRQIAREWLSV